MAPQRFDGRERAAAGSEHERAPARRVDLHSDRVSVGRGAENSVTVEEQRVDRPRGGRDVVELVAQGDHRLLVRDRHVGAREAECLEPSDRIGQTLKDIPKQPFADLLKAFRHDQTVKRYPTWDAVLDYCMYSANPVGRLVLYLCGYRDAERQRLSDATCTALQLANFWQDVSRDLEKGRIYIPLDAAAAQGLTEEDIVERRFDDRYVRLMKDLIARSRANCSRRDAAGKDGGQPAQHRSGDVQPRRPRGAGRHRSAGYDTLHHRPSISKANKRVCWARSSLRISRPKIVIAKIAAEASVSPLAANLIPAPILRGLPGYRAQRPQQFLLRIFPAAESPSATDWPRCMLLCA